MLGERLQRAVDGREADAEATAAQLDVELLGAGPVRLALELADDGETLDGGAQTGLAEELGVLRLRRGGHVE